MGSLGPLHRVPVYPIQGTSSPRLRHFLFCINRDRTRAGVQNADSTLASRPVRTSAVHCNAFDCDVTRVH
jgi:hypothetical protein